MKTKRKTFPTLAELVQLYEQAFFGSYCKWLNVQNPHCSESFTIEQIVNYMNSVRMPWVLRYVRKLKPLDFYKNAYLSIKSIIPNADLYPADTHIVPLDENVEYTFVTENIKYPSDAQLKFARTLNSKFGSPISDAEFDTKDSTLCSLSIALFQWMSRKGADA